MPPLSTPRTNALECARALHRQGVAANNAGHPARAIRTFGRALKILDSTTADNSEQHDKLRARLMISATYSVSELNGVEAGLSALINAAKAGPQNPEPDVAVHIHLQMGLMQYRGGDIPRALNSLNTAASFINHADPAAACNILVTRGAVWMSIGDLASARSDLSEASRRARYDGLIVEECKARHNLGYLEFLAGNLASALHEMDAAAQLGAEVSESAAILDRARVLLEAGLHREADDALTTAIDLCRAARLWQDVGEVELARAQCALLDGEVQLARAMAGKARDRFRRRGNDAWRRQAELVLLQADIAAGRPGSRLVVPAKRLVLEFRQNGLETQARTAQLISVESLLRANRPADAREIVDQLPRTKGDPISVRLYDHYVRARLAVSMDDSPTARRHVRNGLTELSQYQSSFGSIDLQSGSAVHGRRLAELDVEMALKDGRPAALLEAVERGRATSNRLIPVQSPADDEAAALLAELRQTIEAVRAAETDPLTVGQLRAKRERVADIQRSLRARSWHADGSRQAERPARAKEILAGLAEHEAEMACYVQVGDSLHALTAGGRGTRLRDLGSASEITEVARRVRADLDAIANGNLPSALVKTVHRGLRRSLAELDQRLIAPVKLGGERVVIVPTGMMAMLPWGSLPSLRGRPVVVAPSGSSWLAASGPRDSAAAPEVAVFAGPGLLRSDEEAVAVAKLWDGSSINLGAEARQDGFVAAMAEATVVHVAAHGEHQAENPLFSSIRLSDGPVFAYEFDQTASAAEHVVLSACELGMATIRPGDEALGLTSVLLHLGTRSVVAGVARVHDDVAAEVMVRYHTALAAGHDSARALADACAAEKDLPAPFVCFGATWHR